MVIKTSDFVTISNLERPYHLYRQFHDSSVESSKLRMEGSNDSGIESSRNSSFKSLNVFSTNSSNDSSLVSSKASSIVNLDKLSTVGLSIAIYTDEGFYRHWTLFIDEENNPTIHHVIEPPNWRYKSKTVKHPRTSKKLEQLIPVGTIQQAQIDELKETAEALPTQRIIDWNCQNWVLDLLTKLKEKNLLSIPNERLQSLRQMEDRRRFKYDSGRQSPDGSQARRWIMLLDSEWKEEYRNTVEHPRLLADE